MPVREQLVLSEKNRFLLIKAQRCENSYQEGDKEF
jgi:hypothetical protein